MRQLLVTLGSVNYNTDAIAGEYELDTLTAGSLVCFDGDGEAVSGTAPSITTDSFKFGVGRSGTPELSVPIDISSLDWYKETYSAPVAKVMYVGHDGSISPAKDLNITTPLTVGDVAGIQLINKAVEAEITSRVIDVEYVVKAGDTELSVMNGLIAAINANTRAAELVTAASASATIGELGFSLTAATAGVDFSAIPSGLISEADTLEYKLVNGAYSGSYTTAVANNTGHGYSSEVLATESDFSTHEGNTNSNYLRGILYSKPSNVVTGETYVQYTLLWRAPDNNDLHTEPSVQQKLVIAVPSSETGASGAITAMDNILGSL